MDLENIIISCHLTFLLIHLKARNSIDLENKSVDSCKSKLVSRLLLFGPSVYVQEEIVHVDQKTKISYGPTERAQTYNGSRASSMNHDPSFTMLEPGYRRGPYINTFMAFSQTQE